MNKSSNISDNTGEIVINRARFDEIQLYEISEDELTQIESGSPSSNYLNFSIALLSFGASLLITLLTTKIDNDRQFMIYVCITVISLIAGLILLQIWVKTNKISRAIFNKIRARKDTDEIRSVINSNDIVEPTQAIGKDENLTA